MNASLYGLRALAVGTAVAAVLAVATPAQAETIDFSGLGDPGTSLGASFSRGGFTFTSIAGTALTVSRILDGSNAFIADAISASGGISVKVAVPATFDFVLATIGPVGGGTKSYTINFKTSDPDKGGSLINSAVNYRDVEGSVDISSGLDSVDFSFKGAGTQLGNFQYANLAKVPGPIAGAGLPILLAGLGGYVALRRRKAAVAA